MQRFYTVRSGDTLSRIAKRWEIPVDSFIAANNLSPPYTIYIGEQLSVPPGVDVTRVKQGDSVYKIAQYFGVPQSVIIETNQLQHPYILQVGQLLRIPPGNPYYIVQSGDTLYQLARKYNVITAGQINYELIRQINRLSTYDIYPGMKLIIPYAPPGKSGMIAYTANFGDVYDIWLYHPSFGPNVQLTTGLGESFSTPFWSSDSSKIGFIGRNGILYVVNISDGSISRLDQFIEGEGVYLSWSPDSQTIAYSKQNEIILYQVNSHQVQRIAQPGATDVQWFPSGMELLFQAADGAGNSQLYRIRKDGTGKRQLTQNSGGSRYNSVRLSPNGVYVLYTSPGASISLVFIFEIATGNIVELRGGPLAKNYFPVWSPDSSTVAYSATAFENVGYFSLIRTSGLQGENERTRAISNCFATPITWSPDGRNIAYLSGCNNQGVASEMWLINLSHPVPIRLLAGGFITAAQWSPVLTSPLRKTYTNSVFAVQFQYPGHWMMVTDEKYEGKGGFFQISAIFSEGLMNEVCHNEAFHQLLPYGTEPQIIHTQIQAQEACFIYPSADQPPEMNGQAALIVRYPTPIQVDGTTYNFFILWADKYHIDEIGLTLRFL
jgi:TolB protein